MVFAFPVDIPLKGMLVFSIHKDMEVSSPQLSKSTKTERQDPDVPGGSPLTWNVNFGDAGFSAGETLGVILNIDSLILRQINRGALKTVGALVIGCLIAILAGLYLGRRGPRVEALLSQASGEELIERIARLDVQFEKKLVNEAEYRNTRERLLSLARYEVPELAGVTAGLTAEAPPPALGLPPEAARLIQRFREIDADSSGDPRQVQERLLLLEELAKILSRSPAANTVPDPVSNSGGADSKTEARR